MNHGSHRVNARWNLSRARRQLGVLLTLAAVLPAGVAGAQEAAEASGPSPIDVLWTLIAACMVFLMQAGFAAVEAGFTRAKNAVNIMMKNLMDFAVGSLGYFLIGFGLMFGAAASGPLSGWIGTSGFALSGLGDDPWPYTFMLFQTVFAATAATIVSGAVAERVKFTSYLLYSVVITVLIYPVFGAWAWGGLFNGSGWLENLGGDDPDALLKPFTDFAGSTVVHSVGGWLALAGALVVGPRIGKYGPSGNPRAIPGHNIPLAAIGVFLLWFGWFGFNAGSTTAAVPEIGRIALVTNLSAAAGAIAALATSWVWLKSADASMALNGALAGLVGITAGCATLTPFAAIGVGLVSGGLVVTSVILIDAKLKIDDPVGAISVHGVCGAWGTLACGLLNAEAVVAGAGESTGLLYGGGGGQLLSQAIGVAAAFFWAFGCGLVLFWLIKKTVGLRVSAMEERRGLDVGEHGMEGYDGFQIFTTQ